MGCKESKTFKSNPKLLGSFMNEEPPQETIKAEPMFFNSSVEFAKEKGGPITKAFLNALPAEWFDGVFDSRIHMLMPGWYPAIPGWHHDDVPRPPIPVGQHFGTAGQPDYDSPRYQSEHIMGLVNGAICPTEFAVGQATMPAVPDGEVIYKLWHKEVEQELARRNLSLWLAPSLQLIHFDWQTFHQGRRAVKNGWRWFGRITRNSDRCKTITNEIRQQVQVYLEFPMEGW